MTSSNDHAPPRPPKTKRRAADPELLRSQKQPGPQKAKSQTPPAPTPKPTQNNVVRLASGETRYVKIEATNDKEWNDLAALTEGATVLSLDHKDITHRTIAAIAALRMAHEDDWKPYCESRGLKWRKEAKSPFQCAVMWVLNRIKTATGENTSKASMIAGCLDEYWEIHRPAGFTPAEIAGWLDKMGGYTAVYRERLDRLRDPKDKIAERYGRYLALPPLEQRDIPEWLSGFAGEVVLSAHIDRNTGKLEYRSVWQPNGSVFWYGRLDQFIAARPDYGKAVEPVRAEVEPAFDSGAGDVDAEPHATREHEEPRGASDDQPLDPETVASLAELSAGCEAIRADLAASGQKEAETDSNNNEVVPTSDVMLVCKEPGGCHYGNCQGTGRCLAALLRDERCDA